MYATTETGLAPEIAYNFSSRTVTRKGLTKTLRKVQDFEPKGNAAHYLLRPEGKDFPCKYCSATTIFVPTMIYHSPFHH